MRLRIIGGGPELPRLRALTRTLGLEAAVELIGEVPESRTVTEAYHEADLFCLPTLQEGFGITYLEAMAAGIPIVACRAAAVPEVVPEGEVGLLVEPGNDVALAKAITRLLRDRPLRDRMGAAGRAYVERYDWPKVAQRFLEATALEHRPVGKVKRKTAS